MNAFRPRVSIGLSVYNGARYLKDALQSLLAQTFLALLGRYHEIPEVLFLNRDHPARSARVALPQYHTHAGWFDTKKMGRISLPFWRMLFGYL